MDFSVRKARADGGGADDDLGTFLAIVDSSAGCMRAIASETKGATDYIASSVADFVKNPVRWKVQVASPQRTLDQALAEKGEDEKCLTQQRWRVQCDTTQRATVSWNGQFEQLANN